MGAAIALRGRSSAALIKEGGPRSREPLSASRLCGADRLPRSSRAVGVAGSLRSEIL